MISCGEHSLSLVSPGKLTNWGMASTLWEENMTTKVRTVGTAPSFGILQADHTLECDQCQGRGRDQMKNKFVIFQLISRLLTRSVMYCYLMVWQLLCYWWTGSKRHPRHNVKFISPTHSHYRRAHRWTQVCSYCRLLVTHIYITFFHLINTWS